MKALAFMLVALLLSTLLSANELHPPVPLLDASGQAVMLSGQPMSSMETCGACHDAAFISESSDHRAAGVFGDGEMQCLVCHSDFEPAERFDLALFNADGSLLTGMMDIRKPLDRNCAACHSLVDNDLDEPLTIPPRSPGLNMTDRTGQIISPQKISNSGLNLANKNTLTHPFDVHADRVVGCVDCHYSLNNPVYYRESGDDKPVHLDFDPRRLTMAEYLLRPMHQLAKGSSRDGLGAFESNNSMRRCESCHDATAVHDWLPYKRRHFESLACEACHVPKLYGPALQALDWTVVDSAGNPRREYRSVEGDPASADSLIHGFRPVMLVRDNVGGERKLAPFNLVSRWHWLHGEGGEPISGETLARALYRADRLHPELLATFDDNGDGTVDTHELVLDSADKVSAVAARLQAAGIEEPFLSANIHPYPVSHNVVNGRWATRDCRTCHGADSVLGASFTLSGDVPGDVMPVFIDNPGSGTAGAITGTNEGGAEFMPDTAGEGYYVIGLDSVALVDLAGLGMFLAISLGVSGHGMARYFANRRRPKVELPTQRIKLYDAYERIWHWLQASTILLLIFTGLIIHKPHFFGMFSFAYVVQVHNVLGFIPVSYTHLRAHETSSSISYAVK